MNLIREISADFAEASSRIDQAKSYGRRSVVAALCRTSGPWSGLIRVERRRSLDRNAVCKRDKAKRTMKR